MSIDCWLLLAKQLAYNTSDPRCEYTSKYSSVSKDGSAAPGQHKY